MSVLLTTCFRCTAPVGLDPACVLTALVVGDGTAQLAYVCTKCNDLVHAHVGLETVIRLAAAGTAPMTVNYRLPHPEARKDQEPLTIDDLLALHAALAAEDDLAALAEEEA